MAPSPVPQAHHPSRRTHRRTALVVVAALLAAAGLAGCEPPTLSAQTIVSGRSHVWEIVFTPTGTMLWTERDGRIMKRTSGGTVTQITADLSGLRVAGETGLMGLAVDPQFSSNRRIYTCMGWTNGATSDVRVIPWVFNGAGTALTRQAPIISGMPATSGRHGGCRLLFDGRPTPLRRHRRRRRRHQPAGPRQPGREGPAGEPRHRGRLAREPLRQQRERQHPPDLQLRPPQRAGPRHPPQQRHVLDGRARPRSRRRGQPGPGRQLRLEPGARVQRGRPDDRHGRVPRRRAGAAGRRGCRPWPPPASPGSTAASGTRGTSTSSSPRSRASACCCSSPRPTASSRW